MNNFKLIDSSFTVDEAKQVLLTLLNNKIQFHSHRVFSNDERFGIDDKFSKNRIVELEEIRKELIDYFNTLGDTDQKINLTSVVNIEILESKMEVK